ncbi:MAG: winged helix-turn-helix transcriptional regulator [Alphaproteobacteria bacterium]|nr:winged helix-turn-helix transcriptional regulator [Alphaproteobacteria bacterium]
MAKRDASRAPGATPDQKETGNDRKSSFGRASFGRAGTHFAEKRSGWQVCDCTCLRLRKTSRIVTQIYDEALAPLDLTITQFSIMAHLFELDGCAIGRLAVLLVMDSTTLTRTLKPLEARGLIESRVSTQDKRRRALHLTPLGRSSFEKARPLWHNAQRKLGEILGVAEVEALNSRLEQTIDGLGSLAPRLGD